MTSTYRALCVLHFMCSWRSMKYGTSDFVISHSFHTPFLRKWWHHTAPCNVIIRTFLILSKFPKSHSNWHFSANYSTKCNGTGIWVATAGARRRGVIACGDCSFIIHDSYSQSYVMHAVIKLNDGVLSLFLRESGPFCCSYGFHLSTPYFVIVYGLHLRTSYSVTSMRR